MKSTIVVDPTLVIITIYLVCLIYVYDQFLGVEKKIFNGIQQFYTFYPKITSPLGGGNEINTFSSPYPTDVTYQIWLRLAQ